MPPAESRKFLWDALQAARLVLEFTTAKTFADYQGDALLRSGVERQLEIIGEALGQMARRDPETAGRIGELPKIVAFRNLLAHGYLAVDDERVWAVVEEDVAVLCATLEELLRVT